MRPRKRLRGGPRSQRAATPVESAIRLTANAIADAVVPLVKISVSTPLFPATSSVAHVRENMGAAQGPLPDEKDRRRMAAYVEQL